MYSSSFRRRVLHNLKVATRNTAGPVALVTGYSMDTAHASYTMKTTRVVSSIFSKSPKWGGRFKSTSTTTTTTVAAIKPPAPSPVVINQPKKSFLAWYEGHLQTRPIPTKMVTGSILWGVGDAVAQIIPQLTHPTDNSVDQKLFQYDTMRTGRAVLFGFAIHAPLSHLHFNFLEWMTVQSKLSGLKIPVFKAFMEQFVYWSWFSNSLYHGCMAAMQGMTSPQQIYDRIASVLWETQKAQWAFWIPIQLLNFQYVPVRHQLNVVLLTSVVWTALLSAWYPPETENNNDDKESKIQKRNTKLAMDAATHD